MHLKFFIKVFYILNIKFNPFRSIFYHLLYTKGFNYPQKSYFSPPKGKMFYGTVTYLSYLNKIYKLIKI